MTYEQVEKTMQFILDQQAMMAQRQNTFDDNLNRLAAASTEHGKLIDARLDRVSETIAASIERENRTQEMLEKITHDLGILAADSDWHKDSIAEREELINQLAEQVNRVTDNIEKLTQQNIFLGAKIDTLAETVKNMIKGGSNGWPRN